MRTDFEISSLVPSGLVFDGVSDSTDSLILSVRCGGRAPLVRDGLPANSQPVRPARRRSGQKGAPPIAHAAVLV